MAARGNPRMAVSCVRDMEQTIRLLERLTMEEDSVSKDLEELLEQQTQLDLRMALFQHMLPTLKGLEADAGSLDGIIGRASQLADSVSCKVRVLDQAKSRVYACMKRVDDVIDLKSCVDGVQYAMTTGNYEKAAAHIYRYLTLDENILLETTADSSKGGTVSSSFALLRDAETKLREVVRTNMAAAMATSDHVQVERYFKIFPLLNLHHEGLKLFASHVRRQISDSSQANLEKTSHPSENRAGVVYADTLNLLYEAIARCLETNQPLVETYYGPHWMPVLIAELQAECDTQCSNILEHLQAERLLDHKVQTVSIALNSRSATGAIRPAVLELDALLSEISLCSTNTQLYFRFLQRRANTAGASWRDGADNDGCVSIEELLRTCKTSCLEQEMVSKYILIEDYFMRESLSKAVAMDTCNPDGLTSSMADDIFFVLQKCTRRAFASGNVDGACAVLNNASSLLVTEYRNQLQLRLKPSATASTSLDLTGMLQGKSRATEKRESDTCRTAQMVALNDVEISIDNIQKLTKELQAECTKLGSTASDGTKRKLDSCLADFGGVTASFKELRQVGVVSVVNEVLVPALQPALSVFSSFSHVLSEEEFGDYEVNDPFVQQLLLAIETTLADVKGKLLPAVFGHVFSEMTTDIAALLEEQILTCQFNQLGGVQLDKDLRSLTGYLSSHTSWPVRDKFSRLMQMATLLNLETVNELFDYWGGNMMWRLTPSEIRRVLHLRSDFRTEDVNRIKL